MAILTVKTISPPSDDKRWRVVDATMRRHGYKPSALIEALHAVQQAFGYLDEPSLRYVAGSLGVPLSRVYGVATFYHYFSMKPQGEHTCVVCTGTACYIKDSPALLRAIRPSSAWRPARRRPTASSHCSRRAAWARAGWRRPPSSTARSWGGCRQSSCWVGSAT